jgi:hypothetical protein
MFRRTRSKSLALEPEVVAALASVRFALGESSIVSPVLRVDLPESWVFAVYNNHGDYHEFILRPPGIADPAGPRIGILIGSLSDRPTLSYLYHEQGLEKLVEFIAAQDGLIEGEVQHRQVGEHEVALVHGYLESASYYCDYHALILNETWWVLVIGGGSSAQEACSSLDAIDQLIEQAEFLLPEQSP